METDSLLETLVVIQLIAAFYTYATRKPENQDFKFRLRCLRMLNNIMRLGAMCFFQCSDESAEKRASARLHLP